MDLLKKLGDRFEKPLLTDITDNDLIHVNQNGVDYATEASNFRTTIANDLTTTIEGKALDASQGTILKRYADFNINTNLLLFKYTFPWTITSDGLALDITIPSGSIRLPNKIAYAVTGTSGTIPDAGGIKLTYNPATNVFSYAFVSDLSTIVEGADANVFVIVKNIGGVLYTSNASLLEFIKVTSALVTLSFVFDDATTDSDPGTGNFKMDSTNPLSVTYLYLSKTSQQNIDVSTILLGLAANSSIQIIQNTDATKFIVVTIGTPENATDYVKIPVTSVDDSGIIFQDGEGCATSLFYQNESTGTGVTRNYVNPTVTASALSINFDLKNEAWATKSGGGEIVVNENITLAFANTTNANRAYVFLDVTTATRDVVIDANVISSDSRWVVASTKLVLPVAKYLLIFDFDGSKKILKILPDNNVNLTGDQEINGQKRFNDNIGLSSALKIWDEYYRALETPFNSIVYSVEDPGILIGENCYYNDGVWKYKYSGLIATRFEIANGKIILFSSESGTADAEITTFVELFRVESDGKIKIPIVPSTATPSHAILYRNSTTGIVEQLIQFTQTSVASSATPTPTGNYRENEYYLTALAADATFAVPSGTPANGNTLIIRVKDNETARSLGFNAIYRAIGETLPTTTIAGKTLYIGCIYNSADSKWDVVRVVTEL